MRTWWSLYKKELYDISFFMLVVILLIAGWELFLFYKAGSWEISLPFGLSFIPFSILPFLLLWLGYNSFRHEWKDDTIYFLLSLPRPGWQLSLSKVLAGLTFYVFSSLFTTLLIYIFYNDFIKDMLWGAPPFLTDSGIIINFIIKALLLYVIAGLVILILSQFAQLISQFYDRFQGLISIVVFILANYIIWRGGNFLGYLFKWVPDIKFSFFDEGIYGLREISIFIGSGPIVGTSILIIGLFILGSWVLENYLEV